MSGQQQRLCSDQPVRPVGSLTPEVQQFLDVGNSSTEGAELSQVQAFISGDLGFGISPDPISIAAGVEYRDYYAFSRSTCSRRRVKSSVMVRLRPTPTVPTT